MTNWHSTEPIVLIETTQIVQPVASNPARRLIQPAGYHDWSSWKSVTFQLLITSVTGSPTAFSMQPRFMFAVPHTTGNIYRQPSWYYADTATLTSRVVEGTNFPSIDQTTSLPYVQERTIREPLKRLIAVDLGEATFTMTGGTNPGLRLALVASPGLV